MPTSVNGTIISEEEVREEFERLKPHYDQHVRPHSEEASDQQLEEWSRENVIERILVRQAAALEQPIPAEELDEAWESVREQVGDTPEEEVRADIELNMKIERMIARVMDESPEVDEQMCRKWYEENLDQFEVPEQVRVRHIVKHIDGLHSKEEAYSAIQEVKIRLEGGEDFEAIAAESSDCPDQAGDLGYFPRGQMVEEFEEVVFNMEKGQVSDIVLTQFGYHIARLEDKIEAGPAPFEEVRSHIAEKLQEETRNEAMEKFFDELREKATIEEVEE